MLGKRKNPERISMSLGKMFPGEICEHKSLGIVLVLDYIDDKREFAIIAFPVKYQDGDTETTVIRHGLMAATDVKQVDIDPALARHRQELFTHGGLDHVVDVLKKRRIQPQESPDVSPTV